MNAQWWTFRVPYLYSTWEFCNIGYPSEIRGKLKYREILLIYNIRCSCTKVLKFCTEYSRITVVHSEILKRFGNCVISYGANVTSRELGYKEFRRNIRYCPSLQPPPTHTHTPTHTVPSIPQIISQWNLEVFMDICKPFTAISRLQDNKAFVGFEWHHLVTKRLLKRVKAGELDWNRQHCLLMFQRQTITTAKLNLLNPSLYVWLNYPTLSCDPFPNFLMWLSDGFFPTNLFHDHHRIRSLHIDVHLNVNHISMCNDLRNAKKRTC